MTMTRINWELVAAYHYGILKHPSLVEMVRDAIATDPVVRLWYLALQNDAE